MTTSPAVSVVMTTFNSGVFLAEAVESIMAQTLNNFELIVVDDASTDGSTHMMPSTLDKRLRMIRNEQNIGYAASRNIGVGAARSELIALMDADDIAEPDRLEKQFKLMRESPRTGVCGSWALNFSETTETLANWPPLDSDHIKASLIFFCPFIAPTVMLRAKIIGDSGALFTVGKYSDDYDLWSRVHRRCDFENIPKVLLRRRMHQQQSTKSNAEKFADENRRIWQSLFDAMGLVTTEQDLLVHEMLARTGERGISFDDVLASGAWMEKLRVANRNSSLLPQNALNRRLALTWFSACSMCTEPGMRLWKVYSSHPLAAFYASRRKKARLLMDSLRSEIGLR